VNVLQDITERKRAEPGCIESDIPDWKRAEEAVTAGGGDVPPTVRSREARSDEQTLDAGSALPGVLLACLSLASS
jgi:hypothetical protein